MSLPAESDAHKRFLGHFLRNRDGLYAFILVMVRDRALAEDIFQEVGLVLWEKFDNYEEGTFFGAWARAIAFNKVRNERRRLARSPFVHAPGAAEAVAEAFERSDRRAADDEWRATLQRCLGRLSEAARRLIDLRYFEGRGLEEMAVLLGRTAAGVNSALCKVRLSLETCVRNGLARPS